MGEGSWHQVNIVRVETDQEGRCYAKVHRDLFKKSENKKEDVISEEETQRVEDGMASSFRVEDDKEHGNWVLVTVLKAIGSSS